MTEKELQAYNTIKDFKDIIFKFNKSRIVVTTYEFRKPLSEAHYIITNNRNERTKIANNSCSTCSIRAMDTMYRIIKKYEAEEAAKKSEQKAAEEPKKKPATRKSTTAKKSPAKKRTTTAKSTRKAPRKTGRSTKGGDKK